MKTITNNNTNHQNIDFQINNTKSLVQSSNLAIKTYSHHYHHHHHNVLSKRRHMPKTFALNKNLAPDDPQQFFNEESLAEGLYISQKAFQDYRRFPNKVQKLQETIDKLNSNTNKIHGNQQVESDKFDTENNQNPTQVITISDFVKKKNTESISNPEGTIQFREPSLELYSPKDQKKQKTISNYLGLSSSSKLNFDELGTLINIENEYSFKRKKNNLGSKNGNQKFFGLVDDPLKSPTGAKSDTLKKDIDNMKKTKEPNQDKYFFEQEGQLDPMKVKLKHNDNANNSIQINVENYEINSLDNTFEILKKTKKAIDLMNERCRQVKKDLNSNFSKTKTNDNNNNEDHVMGLTALKTVNLARENIFDDEEFKQIIAFEEEEQMKIKIPVEKIKKGFKINTNLTQNSGTNSAPFIQLKVNENLNKKNENKTKPMTSGDDDSKRSRMNNSENSKTNPKMYKDNNNVIEHRRFSQNMDPIQPNILSAEERQKIKQRIDEKHSERKKLIEEKLTNFHQKVDRIGIVSREDNMFRIESMRYALISRERARTNHELLREVKKRQMQPTVVTQHNLSQKNDDYDRIQNLSATISIQNPKTNNYIDGRSSKLADKLNNNLTSNKANDNVKVEKSIEENDPNLLKPIGISLLPQGTSKDEYHKRLVPKIKDLLTKPTKNIGGGGPHDFKTMNRKLGELIRDKSFIPNLHMDSLRFSKFSGLI